MNEVAIIKVINEKHVPIGEAFVARVVQALQAANLDITGYAVKEYGTSTDERLELNLGDKRTLSITFSQSKY